MDFASSVVIKHELDQSTIEHIDTLRTIRLNLAETMLNDLPRTSNELLARGILQEVSEVDDLRRELTDKITLLRSRLQQPTVIYADEISLVLELMEDEESELNHS